MSSSDILEKNSDSDLTPSPKTPEENVSPSREDVEQMGEQLGTLKVEEGNRTKVSISTGVNTKPTMAATIFMGLNEMEVAMLNKKKKRVQEDGDTSSQNLKMVQEMEKKNAAEWKDGKSVEKIAILFKATGNAPILKKKKWLVEADKKMFGILYFMRKLLQLRIEESLFLYVDQSFSPSLDHTIKSLYDCFGSDGYLVINYCMMEAWG